MSETTANWPIVGDRETSRIVVAILASPTTGLRCEWKHRIQICVHGLSRNCHLMPIIVHCPTVRIPSCPIRLMQFKCRTFRMKSTR